MIDEWSLKDKLMIEYLDNERITSPTQGVGVYTKEDIETLRKKLLFDILCSSILSYPRQTEEMEKIINRRFGMS